MPRCASVVNSAATVYDVAQFLINQFCTITLGFAYAVLYIYNIVCKNAVVVFTGKEPPIPRPVICAEPRMSVVKFVLISFAVAVVNLRSAP